ncbi:HEAT repeat domain-containing protein [Streptomyces sp. QTS52]
MITAVRRDPAGWRVRDLKLLLADTATLVRAAALTALATTGCPPPLDTAAAEALNDPAWQVRSGAATALGAAAPALAVPALSDALSEPFADVREAAVRALRRHDRRPGVADALASMAGDADTNVRAYARL